MPSKVERTKRVTAEPDQTPREDVAEVLTGTVHEQLFPSHVQVVPQLNEVYELELAYYESQLLSDEELIRNGAYFASVGDQLTRHFLMCSGDPVRLPRHSSSRLQSFFSNNQFKTGYGTHGLFPYRGKFHPQMIKAIINIMGLKPGDTVLDPMMGSGTVLIEACLMGVNSIGIDASPFCQFMAQTKVEALTLPLAPIRIALERSQDVFEHFKDMAGQPKGDSDTRVGSFTPDLFLSIERRTTKAGGIPPCCEGTEVYNFLLLAYLDSAGYSERSKRKTPYEQFRAILERYLFVIEKIQGVLTGVESELAEAKALEGDARDLPIEEATVDGIIFSPPYSFAIDYLKNDAFHLGFMGVDIDRLREHMIGLRGTTLPQKFDRYNADMNTILAECARVLKAGCLCTIVVGTNNNQLSKIMGVSADQVPGIDGILVDLAGSHGLRLVKRIGRQITGMANTMRTEYIVMLQRD